MHRALEPVHHAYCPARNLRLDIEPCGARSGHAPHHLPPALGQKIVLQQGERQRPAACRGHIAQHRKFAVEFVEIGDELHYALACLPHRARNRLEFMRGGAKARHSLAFARAMDHSARGRESKSAGCHGFFGQRRHRGDIRVRSGFPARATFAHYEHAKRPMRDLGAEVHDARRAFQRIEEFRKAFPFPLHPFRQHRAGNIFDTFHQFDHPLALMLVRRRKAHAAVAHDRGRHAVPGGWGHVRIPACLAVVVCVDIDPAGRDEQSRGVDLALARTDLAYFGDASCADRHIAAE